MTTATRPGAPERFTGSTSSAQRSLLKCWLLLVGILTTRYAYVHTRNAAAWFVEDWLINYQAGFVRRGLYGELIHFMHRLLGISPVWFVFLLQVTCYGVVFYAAYLLLGEWKEWSIWSWALIVSPATFNFQVVGPEGGFRKEMLFIAGLCVLFLMLRKKVSDWKIAAFLALWLPSTILAHEALFAYFGYYFAALVLGGLPWLRAFRVISLSLVLSAIALYSVYTHHGNAQMASQICASLGEVDPPPCGGAIKAIAEDLAQGHADLVIATRSHHYGLTYAIATPLALFPIIVVVAAAIRKPETRFAAYVLCVSAAVAQLLSMPSYIYAIDWGRWVYIQVFTIALFLIFLDWEHRGLRLPLREVILKRGMARWLACAAIVLYAICWSLPLNPAYGHFGIAQRVGWVVRSSLRRI